MFTKNPKGIKRMIYDVAIVGAGAAGLMAAGTAAKLGHKVILLEKNKQPARKVMITGKGRCNVTNYSLTAQELIANVPRNGRFLYSALSQFMPLDTMSFFEDLGVVLKTERGNRVFPQSDKASDIVTALKKYTTQNGVVLKTFFVEHITKKEDVFYLDNVDGETVQADNVIIATGGMSYAKTGSTGDGYKFAKSFGHTITKLTPSLVPLEVNEGWCMLLQGLSLKNVTLKVLEQNKSKVIYEDFGEMIFTHYGISGPIVLSASAHMKDMQKKQYCVIINLKPALSHEQLSARLQRDFLEFGNKDFINALDKLLPQKLIPIIVQLSQIPKRKKTNQITKEERESLAKLLKALPLSIKKMRPIEEAIITSGGVDVNEINPKTLESKLCSGLYFVGEVIDVDAYTGGFNLQIAFSTGYLAGTAI